MNPVGFCGKGVVAPLVYSHFFSLKSPHQNVIITKFEKYLLYEEVI